MAKLSRAVRRSFTQWGQRGGKARARRLDPARRSSIAAQAARSRWQRHAPAPTSMPSIRLRAIDWEDPVYVEEVLVDGSLHDWGQLYQRIANHPFGPTAVALQQVLAHGEGYGVIPLWHGLLRQVQVPREAR